MAPALEQVPRPSHLRCSPLPQVPGKGKRSASVRAQRATGTALILAKHRVVDEAFREQDVRLVSMSALGRRVIVSAYREGWVAGERVNLDRPMAGSRQDLLG